MVEAKRFCIAPSEARLLLIVVSAAVDGHGQRVVGAFGGADVDHRDRLQGRTDGVAAGDDVGGGRRDREAAESDEKSRWPPVAADVEPLALAMLTVMVWLALAPTWNWAAAGCRRARSGR
jgi:hypothetical protein